MNKEILSIEKGWGDGSMFFSTNPVVSKSHFVSEIKEEPKQVSNDLFYNVFRGYLNGEPVFEMYPSVEITVRYKND